MLMGDRCRIITVHCSLPADPLGYGWIQELKPSRLNSLFHYSVTFDHERSWQRRCFARIRPPPDHKRVEDRKKGGVPDDDCSGGAHTPTLRVCLRRSVSSAASATELSLRSLQTARH